MIRKQIPEFFQNVFRRTLSTGFFSFSSKTPDRHFISNNRFSISGTYQREQKFTKSKQEFEIPYFVTFQKNYNLNVSDIFSLFRKGRFLRFMNENYRMLPFLFSPVFLREVFSHYISKIRIINSSKMKFQARYLLRPILMIGLKNPLIM